MQRFFGYICTEEAFQGGYENSYRPQQFLARISAAESETANALCDLYDAARSEIAKLPEKRTWESHDADDALGAIHQIRKKKTQRLRRGIPAS